MPLQAATRRVPDDFPALQDALDASVSGDTVVVAAGTFAGSFRIGAGVTLRGAGAALTSLDGGDVARVLDAAAAPPAPPTRVEDLSLIHGSAGFGALLRVAAGGGAALNRVQLTLGSAAVAGGGLYADQGSSVTLANCEVMNCSAGRGGGLAALGAELQLTACQVHDNQATAEGGGLALMAGAHATWVAGESRDNRALTDGGALAVLEGQASLGGVALRSNRATGRGGAVYCAHLSVAALSFCDLVENEAMQGGGAIATSCDAALASGGAPWRAAALCSEIQVVHCDVVRNRAPTGAIGTAEGESRLAIQFSVLADHPSGLFCSSPLGQLDVSCCLVYGNGLDLAGACGPSPGPDWVTLDPHFCDLNGGDLGLCANSPALDPGCGEAYFGSHGGTCPECGPSPARRSSWGALKSRYR